MTDPTSMVIGVLSGSFFLIEIPVADYKLRKHLENSKRFGMKNGRLANCKGQQLEFSNRMTAETIAEAICDASA